jgi:cytochrome P450
LPLSKGEAVTLLEDLERLGHEAGGQLHAAADMIEKGALDHPQLLFSLLRRARPVLLTHGLAVVTRYHDVVEVLANDEAFSVEPYRATMSRLAGDFILGTDDGPRYERDSAILRLAAPRSDVPSWAAFVSEQAEVIVSAADRRLNVAALAKRVPARLAGGWLGVAGPDEDTMIEWTLAMFEDIFANVRHDATISARADQAAAALRAYLTGLIGARRDGEHSPDVLGRLLSMQGIATTAFSDDEIRANLTGVVVGFIPTVLTATTLAIDALLDRPDALASAQLAAQADDDDELRAHLWEAMRLAPQGPGLLRRASRDFTVAEGSHHETVIPAGTLTFAATQSAMLDGDVVDEPDVFRVDRPPHHYLHFGTGMHTCFGRFANAMQIPLIAKAVLRRPGLARIPGEEGQLRKEGPFPTSLFVSWS